MIGDKRRIKIFTIVLILIIVFILTTGSLMELVQRNAINHKSDDDQVTLPDNFEAESTQNPFPHPCMHLI